MLLITVSDEFSRFFEALPDADAEHVAAALDLVAEAGSTLGPDRARRLLLWYDGTRAPCRAYLPRMAAGASATMRRTALGGAPLDWLEQRVEDLEAYRIWQSEALRCLSSQPFSERLRELDPRAAVGVLESVQALRERLSAAVQVLPWARHGASFDARHSTDALRGAFEEVMRAVGLDSKCLPGASGGLRELTLRETTPALRILYGLCPNRPRAHVLLADRLDHAYYGNSVRRAEQSYSQWLASLAEDESAPPEQHP